jgi:hypothetical protein
MDLICSLEWEEMKLFSAVMELTVSLAALVPIVWPVD